MNEEKKLPGVWVQGPDLIVDKNLTVSGRVHLLESKGDLFTWMDGADADVDELQGEMDTAEGEIDTLQESLNTVKRLLVMQAFSWGTEALWVPKYASDADEALVDLMGNGHDLTYANYSANDWSKGNGWAGSAAGYFDTGILPALEQTIYVAFSNVVNPNNNATPIGVTQYLSDGNRNHLMRIYTAATDDHRCAFMATAAGVTPRVETGVLAMNKDGFWLNGVEFSAQNISTSYTYTRSMYLMCWRNASDAPGDFFNDGYVAAAAIINATDTDSRVFQRSRALMNLLGL